MQNIVCIVFNNQWVESTTSLSKCKFKFSTLLLKLAATIFTSPNSQIVNYVIYLTLVTHKNLYLLLYIPYTYLRFLVVYLEVPEWFHCALVNIE